MLLELTRALSNATINSKVIDKRDIMLMFKITNSAEDGYSADALMVHLIAVQRNDLLNINETHHSVFCIEMRKIHEWDKSGVETIQFAKLMEVQIQELEGKYRQHLAKVQADQQSSNE